mmetsp:Transcript_13919/g.30218  ORF Transcript_13919/g.30218 Transcript_13919/m.30218 type:complete len:535 (-) Transcript_13919:861-2465(-)
MDRSSSAKEGRDGGLSPDKTVASSRSENVNEIIPIEASNDDGDDIPIHPALYYASVFLIVATLLQVLSTFEEKTGPFDWFAGMLIPRFLSMGFYAGRDLDDLLVGTNGRMVCPPDQWIDETFSVGNDRPVKGLYSLEYDPRKKVFKPSLFPHCALLRWVQLEKEHNCPAGHEYVTVIHPPAISRRSEGATKIPKIIHLSSPTNCLPSYTAEALRRLTHEHVSQAYAIYVHSSSTMDNFLFQREWTIFPQVKEGVLCGTGKLNAVAEAAIKELKVGNSTDQRRRIADRITLGLKRDIWRYMVLWEYGGITLDIDALHAILREGGSSSTKTSSTNSANASNHGGYATLRTLMHQWNAEKNDALLYFINNVDKQRLPYKDRIPSTDIMGMAPHHPLVYYCAKVALRIAVWDSEKSITDTGRTTKVPPMREGLAQLNRGWKNTKTGEVMEMKNENKNSIHFLDGDAVLPPALSSPRTAPWRSIFVAFQSTGTDGTPSGDSINAAMRGFAGEQKYIPRAMFSCMEYTLDMYLQTTTVKK